MDTERLYAEYVNTSFVKSVEPVVIDRALQRWAGMMSHLVG